MNDAARATRLQPQSQAEEARGRSQPRRHPREGRPNQDGRPQDRLCPPQSLELEGPPAERRDADGPGDQGEAGGAEALLNGRLKEGASEGREGQGRHHGHHRARHDADEISERDE